jgi:capsular exopolysaccharide synthesis family protein
MTAALLEQLDQSLHSPEDLEPIIHTSLLGTMPLLKGRAERRLSHLQNPSIEAPLLLESCRIVRSNLQFAALGAPLRTLLVTSADPGEGKSLSALNMATAMAMDGRRVILLDCDLRRPMQHYLHETALEPGFSNVLTGEATIEEALRPTKVENLSLMTAGSLPPNPPELLNSEAGRQLINDLKERCDLVVLDSPPVLSLSDAQVLGTMVDGIVLVVAADSTSQKHVRRAESMLRQANGRLLGVLFNKVREYNNPYTPNSYYTYGALENGASTSKGLAGLLSRGR